MQFSHDVTDILVDKWRVVLHTITMNTFVEDFHKLKLNRNTIAFK